MIKKNKEVIEFINVYIDLAVMEMEQLLGLAQGMAEFTTKLGEIDNPDEQTKAIVRVVTDFNNAFGHISETETVSNFLKNLKN